jgi:hypothetical protein
MRKMIAGMSGVLFCLTVLTVACASPDVRPYSIVAPRLSCERAHQLSTQVLARLGYATTGVVSTTEGEPSVVRGVRTGPYGEERVSVRIACGADGVHVDANPEVSPCEQANRLARQSVERLGYVVDSFTPAVNEGRHGLVKATKVEGGQRETVALTITCTNEAVFVDARSDNPVVASADFTSAISDFRRGFFALFKPMAEAEQKK